MDVAVVPFLPNMVDELCMSLYALYDRATSVRIAIADWHGGLCMRVSVFWLLSSLFSTLLALTE